jgi:diguanylate cyclase (GGDEF)-like protein
VRVGISLLVAHVLVLLVLGTNGPGPLLSDLIQLSLGVILCVACVQAARRSQKFARYFWLVVASAFFIWLVPQFLGAYGDFVHVPDLIIWLMNLLFCFWFVPLVLALFLDPDSDPRGFDWLFTLDFVQGVVFCLAAYLYFFVIPARYEPGTDLAHSVWAPYFVGYALVAAVFVLRSMLTHSNMVRVLFRQIGLFLICSCAADALYYYGPGVAMKTGAWFDIIWSSLLLLPLLAAASWEDNEVANLLPMPVKADKLIVTQLFPVLYPGLILAMSARIAREQITLAAAVILLSFICWSVRLLVMQHRLLKAKEELRKQATHDGLTGIWNRIAILEILERELVRGERDGRTVGVIMADLDHFKDVNDKNGHLFGDRVLRAVADQVSTVIRPYDAFGRYGGEEFLIVAPGCGPVETWELAERVRTAVASCTVADGSRRLQVTISLGTAVSASPSDPEGVLRAADAALYEAKHAGRDRVAPRPSEADSLTAPQSHLKR